MDKDSSILKSSWHSTHFWSPEEQVEVKIEKEGYVHIQILTKSVASRFFSALAAFFGFTLREVAKKSANPMQSAWS